MEQRPPHWSEGPSTFSSPPSPARAVGGAGRGRGPSRWRGINKSAWIAIAVVVCVVVAAVVTYVALSPGEEVATDTTSQTQAGDQTQTHTLIGPSATAADAQAQALVRDAMSTIEFAYMEALTFDPARLTPVMLKVLEPTTAFVAMSGNDAATAPTARADAGAVDYSGTESAYAVGAVSASGTTFGVTVDKFSGAGTTYYVDGGPQAW